jgi:hypothetical protein
LVAASTPNTATPAGTMSLIIFTPKPPSAEE